MAVAGAFTFSIERFGKSQWRIQGEISALMGGSFHCDRGGVTVRVSSVVVVSILSHMSNEC